MEQIALPGLKPSLRSYGADPTRWPLVLTGIAAAGQVDAQARSRSAGPARVKRLSGNGSRHGLPAYGWQSAAGSAAGSPAPDAAAAS